MQVEITTEMPANAIEVEVNKRSERNSAIAIAAATGTKADYGDDAIGAIMAKARRRAPS